MPGGLALTSVAVLADQLFSPAPGGMGTYVRELVPAMRRADPALEVTLFHARFGRALREKWAEDLPRRQLDAPIRVLYPGWALAGRPRLPADLASARLVHSPLPAAVPPAAGSQRLVVTVHDVAFLVHPETYPRAWRLMYRAGLARAVRHADAVLVPSRHTAGDLVRRTRISPARVHVTPLAASVPESAADPDGTLLALGVRRPYLLFVGTLEPRKNLRRLVRAYRSSAAGGLPHSLVLAGPMGWDARSLLSEIARPGPGTVTFTGWVRPEALDALYRGADAFVYPSLYEGFGLPVLEAMARGRPCVVSSTSSLPEVAGDAAVLVDPRSEADLAAALERVVSDAYLAARLAEAGRARAGEFSWDRTARATLAVYRSLAG